MASTAEVVAEIVARLHDEYEATGDRAYRHAAAIAESPANRAQRPQERPNGCGACTTQGSAATNAL